MKMCPSNLLISKLNVYQQSMHEEKSSICILTKWRFFLLILKHLILFLSDPSCSQNDDPVLKLYMNIHLTTNQDESINWKMMIHTSHCSQYDDPSQFKKQWSTLILTTLKSLILITNKDPPIKWQMMIHPSHLCFQYDPSWILLQYAHDNPFSSCTCRSILVITNQIL